MGKILVTGSSGQIGSDLVVSLGKKFGFDKIVGTDLKEPTEPENIDTFIKANVTDYNALNKIITENNIDTVYHLASLLSATGEKRPDDAWNINMSSLKNVLDIARENDLNIFWPSSIAAFGPSTPKNNTPQKTILEPNTMYGITKVSGELLCNYYFEKYEVNVRSLRYPGLISFKAEPGGGTTDYAVAMYYEALRNKKYECFVSKDTVLPMMYMPDAINATIKIMEAPENKIKIRTSYNVAALSFSAKEQCDSITSFIPEFTCTYKPDERQKIADSWPSVVDDSKAREDWDWQNEYSLSAMTKDMLEKLSIKLGIEF